MQVRAFTHPAAWQVDELGPIDAKRIPLKQQHVDALLGALERCHDVPLESLTANDFALPKIRPDLARWTEEVKRGRGFVWLEGLPVEGLSTDQACTLFYGLGAHFGQAVSQSNDGEVIGHVVNLGGGDRRQRAFQSARALNLHTDRCDLVGMLCLRPAASGGVSGYASALAVHNEMLRHCPQLLPPLYEGFRLHRFGESADREVLTSAPVPIFSIAHQVPNVIYIRGYIDLAINEGWYELSALQQEALDTFDEIARSPEFCLYLTLSTGEATFTNNSLLLHNRSAFDDHDDPALSRHLLRLWLMDPEMPATDAVRAHKSLRGVERIEGRGTYYTGHGLATEQA